MEGRVIQTSPELKLLLQKSSELIGVRTLFVHIRPIRILQIVVVMVGGHTRDDVHMIMPRILSARRFVVLTNSHTVACICVLESNGDLSREIKNMTSETRFDFIDVFLMNVRDDNDVSRV